MRAATVFLLISLAAVMSAGQSRRVVPGASTPAASTAAADDMTFRQRFETANSYLREKAAEFDAKKVAFSDSLFRQTKLEQRQLAAKYAAIADGRTDLKTEDLYYVGMLHWIAENLSGASDNLRRFVAATDADPNRRQTARSVVIVILAKQSKLTEAESEIAEYLKTQPQKLTERSRIGGEMAKAYQTVKDFRRMIPHAEAGYEAAKSLLSDSASRARGLDEILDAAMLVFEAKRDAALPEEALAALDEMKRTAAEINSPSFYYYAVDQRIRYMIDIGRKPAALQLYSLTLSGVSKDFREKTTEQDVMLRLKRREKHYKLLGEPAPELPAPAAWFPGNAKPLSSYKGKVLLLDFWATWCTPCFEAFPALTEWQQDHRSEGFEILGITRFYGTVGGAPADEQFETTFLGQFRERERLPYDFVVMKGQAAQNLYGATSLPTAVLIDRKGIVRYIEIGTSSARIGQMREMLLKLLAEK